MTEKPTYAELRQRVRELEARLAAEAPSRESNPPEEIPLSEIIEGSSIPTFVIDRHHVLTHFNRACENLTGITAEELIGTRDQWRAFYSAPRPVMADLLVDRVPESVIRAHYGGKYRPSRVIDGAYEAEDFFGALGENGRWLFFTAAALRNGRGEIIGAIETLQDITATTYSEFQGERAGTLEIMRDITQELEDARRSEAILRISRVLPEYPDLEELLDYISDEIKRLMGTEGATVEDLLMIGGRNPLAVVLDGKPHSGIIPGPG